ncbi:hypothetical protein M408DRAFT_322715, partial [Serendipita vermifera MAFF 305830]
FSPSPVAVSINCLLFASLVASLAAALASVVALQWVADYDAAITRGGSSPDDRAKRRHFRFAGVVGWKMSEIIASLPLLLYSSVLLFFAGLIQWMWNANSTVGYIVAGGAIIIIFFYLASTLVGALFVSSPFRTPLSRLVYLIGHFSLFIVFKLPSFRFPKLWGWLVENHLTSPTFPQREDQAIQQSDPWIRQEALLWLGSHLSISSDSRKRIFLLLDEILNLPSKQLSSPRLCTMPWWEILDTMGQHYLEKILDDRFLEGSHVILKDEDYQAIHILSRCCNLPVIQAVIWPNHWPNKATDRHAEKWYLRVDIDQFTRLKDNYAFLLLRDIPFARAYSILEVKASVQLIRWRSFNLFPGKILDEGVWQSVFEQSPQFSSEYFDACVHCFRTAALALWRDWRSHQLSRKVINRDKSFACIFGMITSMALKRGCSTSTLNAIFESFECILTGWRDYKVDRPLHSYTKPTLKNVLCRPLLYALQLRETSKDFHVAHYSTTLLLARAVESIPRSDHVKWAKTVIVLLCLSHGEHTHAYWYNLLQTYENVDINDLWGIIDMNWCQNAHQILHFCEIIGILDANRDSIATLDRLWLFSQEEKIYEQLVHFAVTLDHMMKENVSTAFHAALIRFIVRDLDRVAAYQPIDFPATASLRNRLANIRDPCLSILCGYACHLPVTVECTLTKNYKDKYPDSLQTVQSFVYKKLSLNDPPVLWQLRAAMSSMRHWVFDDLCHGALRRSEKLLLFQHPTHCQNHHSGPHHLLSHLYQYSLPDAGYGEVKIELEGGHIIQTKVHSLLGFLAFSDSRELSSLNPTETYSPDSFGRIYELCRMTKKDPISLVALFVDITFEEAVKGCTPKSVAPILVCIRKALSSENNMAVIPLLRLLARNLRRLRITLEEQLDGDPDQSAVVADADHLYDVIQRSVTVAPILSTRHTQLLCCAQAKDTLQPAMGWLSMHVD